MKEEAEKNLQDKRQENYTKLHSEKGLSLTQNQAHSWNNSSACRMLHFVSAIAVGVEFHQSFFFGAFHNSFVICRRAETARKSTLTL